MKHSTKCNKSSNLMCTQILTLIFIENLMAIDIYLKIHLAIKYVVGMFDTDTTSDSYLQSIIVHIFYYIIGSDVV